MVRGRGEIQCSNQFSANWVKAQFGKTGTFLNAHKAYTGGEITPVVYRRLFSWYPRRDAVSVKETVPQSEAGLWLLDLALGGSRQGRLLADPVCSFGGVRKAEVQKYDPVSRPCGPFF